MTPETLTALRAAPVVADCGIMRKAPRVLESPGRLTHNRDGDAIMATEKTTPRVPLRPSDITERRWQAFMSKVDQGGECWLWTGSRRKAGYGRLTWVMGGQPRHLLAHRVAYVKRRGVIPDHLTVDHLCSNPPCVNPDHMELVTAGENTLRGSGLSAVNLRKTHCKHGHEFTEPNTYIDRRGFRHCRSCQRIRPQTNKSSGPEGEFICPVCGVTFSRKLREVRANKRRGRVSVCGRKCRAGVRS